MNYNRVFWFAFGAVSGGVTGYLVADLIAYKLNVEEIRANPYKILEKDLDVLTSKRIINEEGYEKNAGVDYSSISKGDLTELANKYHNVKTPKNEFTAEIRYSSEDEWSETGDQYDRVTLTYYTDDHVFCNEFEEPYSVPDEFGGEWLRFGEKGSNDPDIAYVCNESLQTIYEISRIHGSYALLVLGMSEEELKKETNKKKPRTRRKKDELDAAESEDE